MILAILACAALALALQPLTAEAEEAVPNASMHVSGVLKSGLPVTLTFDLGGYEVPQGQYTSINIRFLSKPDATTPSVLPGYPESQITFHAPGSYTFDVILSQISKSSCGGVDSKTCSGARERSRFSSPARIISLTGVCISSGETKVGSFATRKICVACP